MPNFNSKRKNYLCVIIVTDVINVTTAVMVATAEIISAVFADF